MTVRLHVRLFMEIDKSGGGVMFLASTGSKIIGAFKVNDSIETFLIDSSKMQNFVYDIGGCKYR